jgi:dUTP pyrophosphatase
MALPANHAAMLLPRSGLGAKEGIVIGNLIGLIDEDYRGQVMAAVWNRNSPRSLLAEPFLINPMDRIAQMVIVPVLRPTLQWVDTLPATQRGAGGFGSTGK